MSEAQRTAPYQTPDFAAWVDLHGDYLFKYAQFRLRDAAAAEDAVQETFLAALKAYERFQGRGSERTWLVGILKHKITDHFRRISREAPIGEDTDQGPDHKEFFRGTGEWTGHWETEHAPSDWHATPAELLEQSDFFRVFNDWLHRARLHLRNCLEINWFKRPTDKH